MPGLGTIINVAAIIVGGILGIWGKRLLRERLQESLMKAAGLSVLFIGVGGALSKLLYLREGSLDTQGTLMLIVSLALGALLGELLDIDRRFTDFGVWLKKKSGSERDNQFVNAFVTASFTVCIGAMAIIGSIQDGMRHDPSILIAKALLDFIIVAIMSASMGRGCLFSAIPVGLLQGGITLLAGLLAPLMTETALSNISFVGSVLIFCVGVNLIEPGRFKVANLLPAVVVAIIWGLF